MTTQSEVLAFCRAGLDNEAIIAILSAITSRLGHNTAVCEILDAANDALIEIQEAQRGADLDAQEAELWTADDAACKRGKAANTVGRVPAFFTNQL